jgi:hypothetical protein
VYFPSQNVDREGVGAFSKGLEMLAFCYNIDCARLLRVGELG